MSALVCTICTNHKFEHQLNKNLLTNVQLYRQRYHTRKSLAKLSTEQLRDVGISQQQAVEEAGKSFWK